MNWTFPCRNATAFCAAAAFLPSAVSAESPLRLSWPLETALLATGLAGDVLGQYRLSSLSPAGPEDLRRADLLPWDRFAAGWHNPAAAHLSDGLVAIVGGAMGFADLWALRSGSGFGPVFEDGIILLEAVAWSSALSLNMRALAVHPRPLAYGSDAPQSEKSKPEAAGSFHSGHASAAFAGAAYLATVYPLRHPEFRHRGLLWAGSMTAAASVAALRVAAGKHFPSDVIAGAAVGTLLGWLLPQLHRNGDAGGGVSLRAWPQERGFAVQAVFAGFGQGGAGARSTRSASDAAKGREKR